MNPTEHSALNYTGKQICLILVTVILAISSSCVTQREVEYLYDETKEMTSFDEAVFNDYRLKPNDELYIRISSLDEGAANIFSTVSGQGAGSYAVQTPFGASLLSYSVDKEGYLLLPLIGNIMVQNKTLTELSLIVKDSLEHILNHPIVSAKLVNRYVSVLGEVRNPGHFPFSQDKISIYDAIGLAGDITDYGNRNEVLLIRNIESKNLRINLDLTKSDILTSEYYNIRPSDIVYVKPLEKKLWGMRQFPFSVLFSTITTGLLIYNVIR